MSSGRRFALVWASVGLAVLVGWVCLMIADDHPPMVLGWLGMSAYVVGCVAYGKARRQEQTQGHHR